MNKQNKGITLIALVITIIVLLILAGITISAITGNESIMEKAQDAKEKTAEAAQQEQIDLNKIGSKLEPEWDGTVATSFAGGTGSESDPYLIENGAQLAYLASQVNGGNDYSGKFLSIVKSINLGNKEFTPIGSNNGTNIYTADWNTECKIFNGTLNGNNKAITGLSINQKFKTAVGLIGLLGENGIINNIVLYEGTIIGSSEVGGIVGASKGIIEDCQNSINVEAHHNAGGIVGAGYSGSIVNCKNSGRIETIRWKSSRRNNRIF